MEFRQCLQKYSPPEGASLGEGWLTLHDLGELIRRAGAACGFIVQTEYEVPGGTLDWVWLANPSRRPIVAFEIEGPNGGAKKSLKRDFRKFALCGACVNVLALFQVDHDHSEKIEKRKRSVGDVREKVGRQFSRWRQENEEDGSALANTPEVYRDCELMEKDGIERLQRQAVEAMNGLGLTNNHSHTCCTSPSTP